MASAKVSQCEVKVLDYVVDWLDQSFPLILDDDRRTVNKVCSKIHSAPLSKNIRLIGHYPR